MLPSMYILLMIRNNLIITRYNLVMVFLTLFVTLLFFGHLPLPTSDFEKIESKNIVQLDDFDPDTILTGLFKNHIVNLLDYQHYTYSKIISCHFICLPEQRAPPLYS